MNEQEARVEFARAFSWFERDVSFYGSTPNKEKLLTPTWAQVFTELGRIMEKANRNDEIESLKSLVQSFLESKTDSK
jgi:hypothetical protein